jgi:RHS repeat-associated protein
MAFTLYGSNAGFIYDADAGALWARVKGTVNGIATVYIAGIYEYQAGATTHYYEGNALRRTGHASNNGVFYLLQDHLKSSSAVINQNGTLNGTRQYYFPFGGNRGGAFSTLTTKRFTGQYHESSLPGGEGLSYYNARWYDAKLGRFLSADSLVPGPNNPQAFNRYAYVFNNPTRLIDPTGHLPMNSKGFSPGSAGGKGRPFVQYNVSSRSAFGTTRQQFRFYTDATWDWHNIGTGVRMLWEASMFGPPARDMNRGYSEWENWGQRNVQQMPAWVQTLDKALKDPLIGMAISGSLPVPASSLSAKIGAARNAQARVGNTGYGNKTIATVADNSVNTQSGWKYQAGYTQATDDAMHLADEVGYTFPENIRDRGLAGRYHASHAETQLAALAPNQAIGVSNAMCTVCQGFFSRLAAHRGEVQVVADPYKVHIFYPNGSYRSIPR